MPYVGLAGAMRRYAKRNPPSEPEKPTATKAPSACKTCEGQGGPAYRNKEGKLIARPCKKCGKVKAG